jgi:hypothetical protein
VSTPESLVGGDRRATLEALRDHFATRLKAATDRDATAIGRLLRDIEADLAALPNAMEVSRADDLKAKRDARRSGAASKARAARG